MRRTQNQFAGLILALLLGTSCSKSASRVAGDGQNSSPKAETTAAPADPGAFEETLPHRGGVNGYRSLILFDPQLKSGVVALWNSNTSQPGGLEFEVMDMLYGLEFRDWMELDKGGPRAPEPNEVAARRNVSHRG